MKSAPKRRRLALLFLLVAVPICYGQTGPKGAEHLSDYLAKHPWNVQQDGPLLAVDIERVPLSGDSSQLSGFHRQVVRLGTLSVVAPETMLLLDASFKNPPDIYDGLPENEKVEYLLSTFSDQQWKVASSVGIGVADLNQDQLLVFRSIVPANLTWREAVVGEGATLPEETLPSEQADQVKIYLARQMAFTVHQKNNLNFRQQIVPDIEDRLGAGSKFYIRTDNVASRNSRYGHILWKTVPNAFKLSDLDYGASELTAPIAINPQSTIQQVLRSVGEQTHLDLWADSRVAGLPVSIFGSNPSCRDVLKGLALAVTGTYRKVGTRYELTSDIEGIGTREAKAALWITDLATGLESRIRDWKARVGKSLGFKKVGYSPSDNFAPTREGIKWLNENPEPLIDRKIAFSEMPTPWRRLIAEKTSNQDSVALDNVTVQESLRWQFVLPNGEKLEYGSAINTKAFLSSEENQTQERPKIGLTPGRQFALCVRATSPTAAKSLVGLAAKYGFSEVWVQTDDKAILDAATVEGGNLKVKIWLYVRPWEVLERASKDHLDLSVTGTSPSTVGEHYSDRTAYQNFFDEFQTSPDVADLYSPYASDLERHWSRLIQLASDSATEVVVSGTLPLGYEPVHGSINSSTNHDQSVFPILNLGYTLAARANFMEASAIDPIDLPTHALDQIGLSADLPFFPKAPAQKESSEWEKFLAHLNETATGEFLGRLNRSVFLEVRRSTLNAPIRSSHSLVEWNPGDPLPASEMGETADSSQVPTLTRISEFTSPKTETLLSYNIETAASAPRSSPYALDLTQFTGEHLKAFLKSHFKTST